MVHFSERANGVGEGGIGLSWPQYRLSIGCDNSPAVVLSAERTSRSPWYIPRHYSSNRLAQTSSRLRGHQCEDPALRLGLRDLPSVWACRRPLVSAFKRRQTRKRFENNQLVTGLAGKSMGRVFLTIQNIVAVHGGPFK